MYHVDDPIILACILVSVIIGIIVRAAQVWHNFLDICYRDKANDSQN